MALLSCYLRNNYADKQIKYINLIILKPSYWNSQIVNYYDLLKDFVALLIPYRGPSDRPKYNTSFDNLVATLNVSSGKEKISFSRLSALL